MSTDSSGGHSPVPDPEFELRLTQRMAIIEEAVRLQVSLSPGSSTTPSLSGGLNSATAGRPGQVIKLPPQAGPTEQPQQHAWSKDMPCPDAVKKLCYSQTTVGLKRKVRNENKSWGDTHAIPDLLFPLSPALNDSDFG